MIWIAILTTMIELLGNTKKTLMKRGKKNKDYMQNILSQELTNIFCIYFFNLFYFILLLLFFLSGIHLGKIIYLNPQAS